MASSPIDSAKLEELRALYPDPRELSNLFSCFFRELPRRLATLHAGLDRDTPELAETAAHALTGSSACLGAWEVRDLASRVEGLSRSRKMAKARELAPSLEQKLVNLEKGLRQAGLLQE